MCIRDRITPRQQKDELGAMVTNTIGGHKSVEAYNVSHYFPLYLYREMESVQLTVDNIQKEPPQRSLNISTKLLEGLNKVLGKTPTPEYILFYVYAILYAPSYRKKYIEHFKIDFPRIPFTVDFELFGLCLLYTSRCV